MTFYAGTLQSKILSVSFGIKFACYKGSSWGGSGDQGGWGGGYSTGGGGPMRNGGGGGGGGGGGSRGGRGGPYQVNFLQHFLYTVWYLNSTKIC
jgi:hypothetical protein